MRAPEILSSLSKIFPTENHSCDSRSASLRYYGKSRRIYVQVSVVHHNSEIQVHHELHEGYELILSVQKFMEGIGSKRSVHYHNYPYTQASRVKIRAG